MTLLRGIGPAQHVALLSSGGFTRELVTQAESQAPPQICILTQSQGDSYSRKFEKYLFRPLVSNLGFALESPGSESSPEDFDVQPSLGTLI